MANDQAYPWFGLAEGPALEQGDLLLACPRYSVIPGSPGGTLQAREETVKAIILTQSCDLAIRAGKPEEPFQVMLCGFYFKNEFTEPSAFARADFWNEVCAGR